MPMDSIIAHLRRNAVLQSIDCMDCLIRRSFSRSCSTSKDEWSTTKKSKQATPRRHIDEIEATKPCRYLGWWYDTRCLGMSKHRLLRKLVPRWNNNVLNYFKSLWASHEFEEITDATQSSKPNLLICFFESPCIQPPVSTPYNNSYLLTASRLRPAENFVLKVEGIEGV